ncbi:uncharacterized protein I206_107045 [Kwoniella pini CBS 10737]|uniref:DAGKc domain-containing protein n=1 Tax=Kwoniella pini CBS 10737 TaxID=1296096 RepID=A0A1B9HZC6_9TREE|nr:uncharacterized protein I206_05412 [Kwoniella pini CBS 10737]OCF48632.1 hypothetical protein I206_05412 [Kwoniella pini CBS 10737]
MSINQETLHLIVNPVAGHGEASEFVDETVLPILRHLSVPHHIHVTTSPGDAGTIGKSIASHEDRRTIQVAIVGGDGTFHEFIQGVNGIDSIKWEVILFPHGTANALYSSLYRTPSNFIEKHQTIINSLPSKYPEEILFKLTSLLSYLSKSSNLINLPITETTIISEKGNEEEEEKEEKIISHVVLSTSLHASILFDSESLRKSNPGIERFKISAQKNSSKLFYAKVNLNSKLNVKQWDSKIEKWVKPFTLLNENDNNNNEIKGPFTYFLSTSTVDRLESNFIISPLTKLNNENDENFIYITIIRPLRDSLIINSKIDERKYKLSKRAFEVIGKAYLNGQHINLTLPLQGNELEDKGKGEPVVEIFRCTSFEWVPLSEGEYEGLERGNESLICADGAIHTIPQGGIMKVKLQEKKNDKGIYVFI